MNYINNAVYDMRNKIVGYRCIRCERIVQSMFGNKCNLCEEATELRQKIKELENKLNN